MRIQPNYSGTTVVTSARLPKPPSDAPVDSLASTVEERSHSMARISAGLAVGGALGAGVGRLTPWPAAGAAVGAVVGGALGAYLGKNSDRMAYDLRYKKLERDNRKTQLEAEKARQKAESSLLESTGRAIDWKPLGQADLRGVRQPGGVQRLYDGFDSSRDLLAVYSKEGSPEQPYRVDLQVSHLRPAAQFAAMDTTLKVSWGSGADAMTVVASPYDGQSHFDAVFDRVQFALNKEDLRERGWRDGQSLELQASTQAQPDGPVQTELKARSDRQGSAEKVFRWEGKTVYYAVTDRFQNGDRGNDVGVDVEDPERFHGGDWQGVIDKLDYIKSLNVDCIWLSPPYLNERHYDGEANRGAPPKDGFHGYWPMDFSQPEPNFGDMAKLKELTEKAHAKGMKVMLDVVVNHTAYGHPWADDPEKYDWFHHEGSISGLGQHTIENGSLCLLPDLNQDNPKVTEYLIDVHKMWLEQGVDAFRVDAVRHVPEGFLRQFDSAMREQNPDYFAIGEVFRQDPNYVSGYQNRTMDSMFDFPLAYAMRNVFASDPSRDLGERFEIFRKMLFSQPQEAIRGLLHSNKNASAHDLSRVFAEDSLYDNPNRLGTLIDNHDMIRFLSDCGGDTRKLEIALAFLFAVRGTPHVYYGTEVGMVGIGSDNRKDMEFGKNPHLTEKFRQLSGARAHSEALQSGEQRELVATDDTYAFTRMLPEEEVVCAFNNAEEPRTIKIPLHEQSQIQDGAELRDLLQENKVRLGSDRTIEVTLPAKGYTFLQWQA